MRSKLSCKITRIQELLQAAKIPGWLFYDFQGIDPIGRKILECPAAGHQTRRWFYFVPAKGIPIKLLHKIEPHSLDHLPGNILFYAGWRELENSMQQMLGGASAVIMQYSPNNAIPYISKVDAGTVELIRKLGTKVLSSADLVQEFEAVLTKEQFKSHLKAADILRNIVDETFQEIGKRARISDNTTEFEIQQFMMELFKSHNLITNHPPIVAVNEHSGNPHYSPFSKESAVIKPGDFVLIDLWAKCAEPLNSVYADITWTGVVGNTLQPRHKEIFDIVTDARDTAIRFIEKGMHEKQTLYGWQVDDITRNYITERGYGDYFVHRTGHSIGQEAHWNGANIDNFETKEERELISNTCFSIEPGIYLPEFGVRSEVNVYISNDKAIVTGKPIQTSVVLC